MPHQGKPIQLAQERTEQSGQHTETAGETHSEISHGGHQKYKLGDIPSPAMTFWNGIVVMLFLIFMGRALARNLKSIPSGIQNVGEFIVESMMNFVSGIIGPGGEKYTPLIGTIFLYIWIGNLLGQVPYFTAPTANMSTTLALGLIVFIYVQYQGIKAKGFGGYVKHFMGPMPAVSPLLFPIEVISELVKPFTLAMRLFGNVFGEDTVVVVLTSLAVSILPRMPILPLQFPILVMGLLVAFVQAMVFALLTCIYISLQTHHEDDHGHDHGKADAHAVAH